MPNMAYPLGREDPKLRRRDLRRSWSLMTLQYSTQWDSLAHVGQLFDADGDGKPEIVFYNGYRAGEHIVGPVEYRDGQAIERPAGISARPRCRSTTWRRTGMQGRGVMIDLEAHFGRGEKYVGYDELMRIMEADKVEVEEGDLVCLPHRLRPGHPRHEQEPRPGGARTPIPAPRSTGATSGS